jgi:FkbM family methyltransferase
MSNLEATVLECFGTLSYREPQLAAHLEHIAALAQGKGYGTATVLEEVRTILQLLGSAPTLMVDIGGNIGDYTAELRRLHPQAEIHVFEPAAINIERLTTRFAADPQITLVPRAVSESASSAVLFSNAPGSGLASLSKRRLDHFNIAFDVTETIQTIRFEDYWHTVLGGRELDLVKLDIEGHELAALRGFGDAIRHTKVIQFEFGGSNIDTRTFFQDFWYFFAGCEFDLYRITPGGAVKLNFYSERDECFVTTNYIAVARRLGRSQ